MHTISQKHCEHSKTPVNKHDIVSHIPLSVEVYQVSLASVQFWKFLRHTTRPNPWVDLTRAQLWS